MRYGVLGRSNVALYEQCNTSSPIYSPEIYQAMTLIRFGEIKINIKLCNNDSMKSRYQEGYDLTYKFDLPYKALVENTNTISAKYDESQVINDFSWPHCGYGEAGSGVY